MKIALALDDSLDRNDGVQQYVRSLGGWLYRQGHTVEYLAGGTKQKSETVHSLAKNIAVRFNGNYLTLPLPASSARIKALLASRRYDIIHVQMPYSPMLAGKLITLAPGHTAVVGTFHILPFGRFQTRANRLLGRAQQRTLKRFDRICSVSEAAGNFARHAYGLQTEVIPNMIELVRWRVPARRSQQTVRLLFFGRLVVRKGCRQLLLALHALPETVRQELEITIAGDGPQRAKLQLLTRRLGLRATFTGYVAEAHKPVLLASADIAVFPSLGGESFGIVLLEAMAARAGVVIGGDNPGYRSVLGSVPDCLIDFSDTAQAADRLARLIGDNKLRRQLHRKQQQLVKRYDVGVVGNQVLDLYHRALLHRRQDMR